MLTFRPLQRLGYYAAFAVEFYELTAAGRKQLETERKEWERFSAAVALILRDA